MILSLRLISSRDPWSALVFLILKPFTSVITEAIYMSSSCSACFPTDMKLPLGKPECHKEIQRHWWGAGQAGTTSCVPGAKDKPATPAYPTAETQKGKEGSWQESSPSQQVDHLFLKLSHSGWNLAESTEPTCIHRFTKSVFHHQKSSWKMVKGNNGWKKVSDSVSLKVLGPVIIYAPL